MISLVIGKFIIDWMIEYGVQTIIEFDHFAGYVEQQHNSSGEQIRLANFLAG